MIAGAHQMEQNKKWGVIAIACSIVLAIASVVFSENLCYAGTPGDSWINLLLICLRVNVYEEIPGNSLGEHIYLQTKYLLLTCAAIMAVGILWHKGALPVPKQKDKAAESDPVRSPDPDDA